MNKQDQECRNVLSVELVAAYVRVSTQEQKLHGLSLDAQKMKLAEYAEKCGCMVTAENHNIIGGLGSAVVEYMAENGYNPTIKVMGIPDKFIEHGTPEELYRVCGMDKESVLHTILKFKEL